MVNLASGLVGLGVAVDFVLIRAEGQFLAEVPAGVRIIDLQARRAITAIVPLIRYLYGEQPKVLLSALDHANVIAVAAQLFGRNATRVIVSVHAPLSWTHGRSKTIFGRVFLRLIKWTYPKASAVVAVSESVRRDLITFVGLDRHKVHTIHNPIIHSNLSALGNDVISHPWFQSRQVPVILAVGRLSKEKDYPTLIRAFQKVQQKRAARLLILGEGGEKSNLQALVKDLGLAGDVEMPGFVANPYAYMKQSSCYVLSSTFEGFGNVIVEALALGCRVVSTNCPGGPTEILNGGSWGRLVPVGDCVAMAEGILQALDEGPLSHSKALARHLGQFEIPSVTAKYQALFNHAEG